MYRRSKWRHRLRDIGIEPAQISTDDPLWFTCYKFPRGFWVRVAADELRAKYPGESIATDERLRELIARVEVLIASLPAAPR